jgi:hypothetical protein
MSNTELVAPPLERRSSRNRAPEQYARDAFNKNCYPFYDKTENRYRNKQEVLDKIVCQRDSRGNRYIFFKKNDSEYHRLSLAKLRTNGCISNYNEYYDPSKDEPGHTDLIDLYQNCSDTALAQINTDSIILLDYVNSLRDRLHIEVDETIKNFINDLIKYTNLNREGLDEIFKGAFTIIRDKGYFFNKYKCNPASRKCNTKILLSESSHDSLHKDTQYRLGNRSLYKCTLSGTCDTDNPNDFFDLLVGTSPIPEFYGDTWFQFEYANLLTSWNKYTLHAVAYTKHLATKQNVGPFGESDYAEYVKPFILDICNYNDCTEDVCEPIPCVKPNVDLKETSARYISEHDIHITRYKDIKNFIKTLFNSTTKVRLNTVLELFTAEAKSKISRIDVRYQPLLLKICEYLTHLSSVEPYDREEIIEIIFLIFYYIKISNINYDELNRIIDERYNKSTPTGGKYKRKTKITRGKARKYKNRTKKRRTIKYKLNKKLNKRSKRKI